MMWFIPAGTARPGGGCVLICRVRAMVRNVCRALVKVWRGIWQVCARRGSSVDLLRALVPEAAGLDLVEPARAVNLSATDAALIALQARYRAGEDLRRGAWQAVIGDHAQDTAPLGFAAFSEADKAVLDTRYARDLERIAALDGVDLIA